jgi:hypothetical protein
MKNLAPHLFGLFIFLGAFVFLGKNFFSKSPNDLFGTEKVRKMVIKKVDKTGNRTLDCRDSNQPCCQYATWARCQKRILHLYIRGWEDGRLGWEAEMEMSDVGLPPLTPLHLFLLVSPFSLSPLPRAPLQARSLRLLSFGLLSPSPVRDGQ